MIFLYHLSLVIFYIYFQMTRKRQINSLLKYVESKKPRSGEANILSVFSPGLGLGDGIGFLILTYLLSCRGEINCFFIESQSYLFITCFPGCVSDIASRISVCHLANQYLSTPQQLKISFHSWNKCN